jgi:hypothetical protein
VTASNRNDRLAEALADRQLSSSAVAAHLQVDPRTVDRWVEDAARIPRAPFRVALARLVEVPAGVLWPGAGAAPQAAAELMALYPSRAALSAAQVMTLLRDAHERVDVLALSALWLWDAVPGFGPTLTAKAADGVAVRVCLGDPAGASARTRGVEEGIGDGQTHRCALSLTYARRWLGEHDGCLRLHDTTLYASMLRFDDELLVNWHLYGAPAGDSPVLHLRLGQPAGAAARALASFERVWGSAYEPAG